MTNKIKVLLAEDEASLAMILKESLETDLFIVDVFNDGEQAINHFLKKKYDIVILDVMMPKKDGFAVADQIRSLNKNIPIIFLTAKSQTDDVVKGFESGGSDYIKKPFSMRELIVRINALLNRSIQTTTEKIFTIDNYIFDPTRQSLIQGNNVEILTNKESEILKLLVENKSKIVSRSLILKTLWGNDDIFSGRSLDVFITKLRKKFTANQHVKILNIRGIGYKMIW